MPGHSPAHVAFYADGELFSGDLLFAGSVGRVDLPGADWDTLLASVRMLAERLPPETVVHPGHGPETTLGVELARNPFLAELRARRRGREQQVPGAARDARRPAARPPVVARDPHDRGAVRAVRLVAGLHARASRRRLSSSARRGRRPTSCTRRCTRSSTAATAR